MLSPTVVDSVILIWKIARLSSDSGGLGYPRENILAKCAEYGGSVGRSTRAVVAVMESESRQRDADMVQEVVSSLPDDIRKAFEVRHLCIIDGKRCKRTTPHKERAKMLGISKSTYWARIAVARDMISRWIAFDSSDLDVKMQA